MTKEMRSKGRETFGTLVGLIATLCIYSIVFVYAVPCINRLRRNGTGDRGKQRHNYKGGGRGEGKSGSRKGGGCNSGGRGSSTKSSRLWARARLKLGLAKSGSGKNRGDGEDSKECRCKRCITRCGH